MLKVNVNLSRDKGPGPWDDVSWPCFIYKPAQRRIFIFSNYLFIWVCILFSSDNQNCLDIKPELYWHEIRIILIWNQSYLDMKPELSWHETRILMTWNLNYTDMKPELSWHETRIIMTWNQNYLDMKPEF